MAGNRKRIPIPPEVAARFGELDEHGYPKLVTTLMAEHFAAPIRQALDEWLARPRPFDLMEFFASQGESLLCELADGIRADELYRRYTINAAVPTSCSAQKFATALRAYRKHMRLPPWDQPSTNPVTDPSAGRRLEGPDFKSDPFHADPVADPPTRLVKAVPLKLPAPALGPPAPMPKFVRPSWRWDGFRWRPVE